MIPLRLTIRNFMPYADDVPPLSFEGIHTACICGDNGAGKSSLIDAITWALWGKARATSDDDLIRQRQNDMSVEFDFLAGGQRYRIIRKRSRPKKLTAAGQSSLDLFLLSNDGSAVKSVLTGNSISETEKKIKLSILNMDYDTFINSAFLRQGHADEFTRQTPAKRKEVLADILHLSIYDRLEERAKELSKKSQAEKALLETSIAEINQELEQKTTTESLLASALAELAAIEENLKAGKDKLEALRQEKLSLDNKKQQLSRLESDISRTKQQMERWRVLNEHRRRKIGEYLGLIERRTDIEEGFRQYSAARQANEDLGGKLIQLNRIKERKAPLERAINEARSRLQTEYAVSENRIAELEARFKKLPELKKELAALDAGRSRLTDMENKLSALRKEQQERQVSIRETSSNIDRLRQEIKDRGEKLAMLETQNKTAACPLCETELSAEGLALIKYKYQTEIDNNTRLLAEAEAILKGKKAELESAARELAFAEQTFNQERASLEHKASVLAQSIGEAEKAGAALEKENELKNEIKKRISDGDFAVHEREALQALEDELSRLGYDVALHEQVQKRMAAYRQYEAEKQKLEQADSLLAGEREQLDAGQHAEDEANQHLCACEIEKQALAASLAGLPRLESDLKQAEAEYRFLEENRRKEQETVGMLKGKLERLAAQEEKKRDKEKRLAQVAADTAIYDRLAQAFGKNGIQAMIIENAIPEIQSDANDLLGRMTDNRMHLKIEPQRQSKKGDTIETLDINISDDLGIRPYDTYSGGEAFRIDFAIRIALSRLLARRAGAPLRTLIIDEGFGTQDATGIEKLKEAINSVKDSFEKILVITHIDEIKDAFPSRINVTKTPSGSMIEVG